jgi:uncharacterized protein YodC (DUF2158 family)
MRAAASVAACQSTHLPASEALRRPLQNTEVIMSEFKAGDTVKLKSGGPLMTVKAIEGGYAITVWFEGTKHKEGRFLLVTLELDDGCPTLV